MVVLLAGVFGAAVGDTCVVVWVLVARLWCKLLCSCVNLVFVFGCGFVCVCVSCVLVFLLWQARLSRCN